MQNWMATSALRQGVCWLVRISERTEIIRQGTKINNKECHVYDIFDILLVIFYQLCA